MRPSVTSICLFVACLVLAACDVSTSPAPAPAPAAAKQSQTKRLSPDVAARNFVEVVTRMEPIAEAECRKRAPKLNCDFQIAVDDRKGAPPNAFQTTDKAGRPYLVFTLPLIADVQNRDELAFILGHEAAHHIEGHLQSTNANAQIGALVLAGLAQAAGSSAAAIDAAGQVGATIGARTYSKDFELQADALGTVIAARAGYDPVRGSAYFARIPDPGDQFLGTHPPNAQRQQVVRQIAAGL